MHTSANRSATKIAIVEAENGHSRTADQLKIAPQAGHTVAVIGTNWLLNPIFGDFGESVLV